MSIEPFSGKGEVRPTFEVPLASLLYDHPDDVVGDDALTDQEKREILYSWASDAVAVESTPSPRALPSARGAIAIDDILAALAGLDRAIGS
jgi:hypothetical protein